MRQVINSTDSTVVIGGTELLPNSSCLVHESMLEEFESTSDKFIDSNSEILFVVDAPVEKEVDDPAPVETKVAPANPVNTGAGVKKPKKSNKKKKKK